MRSVLANNGKCQRTLVTILILGCSLSYTAHSEEVGSDHPLHLTMTDILKRMEQYSNAVNLNKAPTSLSNNIRSTRQDEGDADPTQTDAFLQITNSFGGVLAQQLIGNILAPQTGDVREFLGGIAKNFINFAVPKPKVASTTTTPRTSYLYQGTRVQPVQQNPGYLINNINLGNRVPAPGQAVPVPQTPVQIPVQSVQVVRLDQITPKTTPPPQKFFWGGDGGAVGKLVNGLVTGVMDQLGLVNRTQQQQKQIYYLPAGVGLGGAGGAIQGQALNGQALGGQTQSAGVGNFSADATPTTEAAADEDSDENRDVQRKISKLEWKLKHKNIPLSI